MSLTTLKPCSCSQRTITGWIRLKCLSHFCARTTTSVLLLSYGTDASKDSHKGLHVIQPGIHPERGSSKMEQKLREGHSAIEKEDGGHSANEKDKGHSAIEKEGQGHSAIEKEDCHSEFQH